MPLSRLPHKLATHDDADDNGADDDDGVGDDDDDDDDEVWSPGESEDSIWEYSCLILSYNKYMSQMSKEI